MSDDSKGRIPGPRPRFRFGVIADIQYCDCDSASNFGGSEVRNYRGTLEQTRKAVALWNGLDPTPLFVAQLGDLIDGQNAGAYGAGKSFTRPQSELVRLQARSPTQRTPDITCLPVPFGAGDVSRALCV